MLKNFVKSNLHWSFTNKKKSQSFPDPVYTEADLPVPHKLVIIRKL